MHDQPENGVPKQHPAEREMLPDDPLDLQAFEVPGDTQLMLRMLVEEYARIGWGLDAILRLADDPNYVVFHGLKRLYGGQELRRRVAEILSRCGVMRAKEQVRQPVPQQLVQVELPEKTSRSAAAQAARDRP